MTILNDKSKLHFQPLLFDSFKYKAPNSTYQDHYNKRIKKQYASINRQYNSASQKAKSAALSKSRKPPNKTNFVQQNINLYKKRYEVPVFDDDSYYREYLASKALPQNDTIKNAQNIYVLTDENILKKQHVSCLS